MAEVAESFGMRPSDVETYYRLGLRARSYILMSMHDLIVGLASRYAAQYRMQQQVRQRPVNQSYPVVVFSTNCCLLNLRSDPDWWHETRSGHSLLGDATGACAGGVQGGAQGHRQV